MENFNNVTQDWTHADQFLDEKINRNTNSIKHDFDIVEKNVEVLNGVAEGQFVTDSTAMSVKVVPENAVKGIVSMIGGKTVKQDDVLLNAPVKKVVLEGKNFFEGEYTNLYPVQNTGKVAEGTIGVSTSIISRVTPNTKMIIKKIDEIGNRLRISTYTEKPNVVGMTANQYVSDQYANEIIIETGENDNWILAYVDALDAKEPRMFVGKYPYNKTTLLLDKIVDKLPDYGASVNDNLYNYVDFEEMVYHHKVATVDLGSFTWSKSSDGNSFKITTSLNTPAVTTSTAVANILSANYDNVSASGFTGNNQICCYNKQPSIRDSKYASSTAADFKTAMTGKELLYELESEELIDISDLLLPFKCEPGGTVTFENEHNLDVPNTVIYEKEMK